MLTGANGTFCAGADLKAMRQPDASRVTRVEPDGDGPVGPTRMLLGKPVIAAVEGHAVAGGLELAAWCDLRVAAEDAVFGVYCRRWGIPLMDGGTIRLARLIGHSHALDLILTGRGVSGEEALRMGLANRLVQPGEALPAALRARAGDRVTAAGRAPQRPALVVRAVVALARATRWPASTGTGWTRSRPASWSAGSRATSPAPGARPASADQAAPTRLVEPDGVARALRAVEAIVHSQHQRRWR